MATLYLSETAHNLLLATIQKQFPHYHDDAKRLPDGRWQVEVSNLTVGRLFAEQRDGEKTISETIERLYQENPDA